MASKSFIIMPVRAAATALLLLLVLLFVLALLLLILAQDHRGAFSLRAFSPVVSMAGLERRPLWVERAEIHWRPCSWWSVRGLPALPEKSNGYIRVECMGGLNQLRRDLCDGVGIARLLNATLLLPHFEVAAYWNDSSGFADIFDVDFFIHQMDGFLNVVRELPADLVSKLPVFIDCPKRNAPFDYIDAILPSLLVHQLVVLRPAASQRLDRYPMFAKAARCQACYQAIRLAKHLEQEAEYILEKIPHPFLALHLRFEPDMIVYSRCVYDSLSNDSLKLIKEARDGREPFSGDGAVAWRRRGKCPLTPKETAFIFHALHIPLDMPIYLAAGDELLEKDSFLSMYTNVYTKNTLLDKEILQKFQGNSKAALDYYISVNSDIYIASYFGNMDKMVVAMRALKGNWKTLVLNRRAFAEASLRGLNDTDLALHVWQTHQEAFISGRGLALPDCFCLSNTGEN